QSKAFPILKLQMRLLKLSTEDAKGFCSLIGTLKGVLAKLKKNPRRKGLCIRYLRANLNFISTASAANPSPNPVSNPVPNVCGSPSIRESNISVDDMTLVISIAPRVASSHDKKLGSILFRAFLKQSKNIFVVAIQFENLTKARNKMDPSFLSWEDAHPGAIKITRVISSTDMLLSRIDGLPQTFGTRFDTGLGLGLAADLSAANPRPNPVSNPVPNVYGNPSIRESNRSVDDMTLVISIAPGCASSHDKKLGSVLFRAFRSAANPSPNPVSNPVPNVCGSPSISESNRSVDDMTLVILIVPGYASSHDKKLGYILCRAF
ncbi:hypothetical protein QYM36_019267, partial [Artemia franciscana]